MKKDRFLLSVFVFVVLISLVFAQEENASVSIQGRVFYTSTDNEQDDFSRTRIVFSSNNSSAEVFLDEEGKFQFNSNSLDNNQLTVKVYLDDCLAFQSNVLDLTDSVNLDISIHDTSFCNLRAFPSPFPTFPSSVVYGPVQKNQSRIPIMLVHGWGNEADGSNDPWGSLQDYLETVARYDVFNLQYYPANLSNRKNAWIFGYESNRILNTYYPNQPKMNVVSHSMGSLTVRGFIQNMAKGPNNDIFPYNDNVKRYVIIAGPIYGSYFANIIDGITEINIPIQHPECQELMDGHWGFTPNLHGGSEATQDLEIGSDFNWELNNNPNLRDIQYLVIDGTMTFVRAAQPLFPSESYCLSNQWEINDGVASVVNSNLLKNNISLVLLDKFHTGINSIKKDQLAGKISSLFFENKLNRSISITDLNRNGRINEIYHNPTDSLSQQLPLEMRTKGAVVLNLTKSEVPITTNSLKLRLGTSYSLERNQNTGRWFYIDKSGIISGQNPRMDFTNLLPIGQYNLIVNNFDSELAVSILPGQVNLVEINLDEDVDGYDLSSAGGTDCNDQNSAIRPNTQEMCNEIDDNCNVIIDEGYDKGNICFVGVGECRAQGTKVCSLDGTGTICNATPLAPTTEVCDNLDNNCDGQIDEGDVCAQPQSILSIHSPTLEISDDKKIIINLTTSEVVDKITYRDNSAPNPTDKTLCNRNCLGYGNDKKKTVSFNDGVHNVTFKAIRNDQVIDQESVSFRVDSKEPKISTTNPTRGFTSGEFSVKFKEENPVELILFYGASSQTLNIQNDCTLDGVNYLCSTNVDLSSHDGQEIQYFFQLRDIANQHDVSRQREVSVDTSDPVIHSLTHTIDRRNVEFTMDVTEANLDKIYYTEQGSSSQKTLCTKLSDIQNNRGTCEKRKSFSVGNHVLTITVLDEAGNEVSQQVSFTIV